MICDHLREVEQALLDAQIKVTYRGRAWQKSREWVYFDCELNLEAIRERFSLPECVKDHAHWGTHDGTEQGLVCERCQDAVMGRHPVAHPSETRFP